MWFDARAKLAEIAGHPPATSATIATQAPAVRPVSRLSQLSQPPQPEKAASRVAEVANVATPLPSAEGETDMWRHGVSVAGNPLTWTGRIVSLNAWRDLTEWERHGPNGRHWCGIKQSWIRTEGE
jgi:hypothetical protein